MMMSVGNSYGSRPVNTVAPVVSGTVAQGQTLSTTDGTWTAAPAITGFTYQWQRSGSNISGATSSTYVIQSADGGSTLRCVVTATNPLGSTSANSNSTASVPLVIGQAFQGGFYTGNIVQGGVTYRLVVAPKASGETSGLGWKFEETAGPSQTITLNNGPSASASMNNSDYPAAQFCEGLSINGYSDWYLPARDELELLYRNLKRSNTNNSTATRDKSSYTYPEGNDVSGNKMGVNLNSSPTGAAYTSTDPTTTTATTGFVVGGAEAFSSSNYWSSSEYGTLFGWIQNMNDGLQDRSFKSNSGFVRAIRRVAI